MVEIAQRRVDEGSADGAHTERAVAAVITNVTVALILGVAVTLTAACVGCGRRGEELGAKGEGDQGRTIHLLRGRDVDPKHHSLAKTRRLTALSERARHKKSKD